ncbi:MAG: sulfur oxidation c-type cytochrome SoxA [Burkholderiales bacterium]|nr:sulfur oxidation c-type cytochrome SoxA [Burkholderiales bacterium]
MKKLLLAVIGASLLLGAMGANATPEQDRKEVLEFYKNKFPNLKFDDYVNGALGFSADALQQYKAIMEFPPYDSEFDKGKKMWETPFKNGKKYADCGNVGKNMAGHYPYFDEKLGKVVTYEMAINSCRKANGEDEFAYSDMKTMGLLTAYSRSLSDGMKMSVKVEGAKALEAYEKGKQFFYQRRGQLSFSCGHCHMQQVGTTLRTEYLSPALGHAVHWPEFRGGDTVTTLQTRYVQCNRQVRAAPFKQGSEEYNNLEYFHSYISNGLPMQTPVFRK